MSIVLDPSKGFVSIQIMYIEEIDEKHGNSRYYFVNSRAEFEHWKGKGYATEDELKAQSAEPAKPGAPAKALLDPKKVIKILRTWWSRMTWKEQNQVYARCLRHIPATEDRPARAEMDMLLFRELKLKQCLKRWDYKDDNGQEVPITDAIIDNLVPEVAQELLHNFELVTEASEDDLKN